MKKTLLFLCLFLLAACVASPAVAPTNTLAQSLIGLPDDAKTLILAFVTAGVAFLLSKVNMGQFTQPLAAALAPILILVLENLLGLIPPSFDNIVLAVIHWIVLFFSGSVGALIVVKRLGMKKTRSLLE